MTSSRMIAAAVMPGPGRAVELRDVVLPALEADSALLRVEASEVCGTDVHLRDGRLFGVPYPIIPGHVSVGILESIRGTMTDVHGRLFCEGDRVTFLDVHSTCHRCWYCLVAKASTRCPHRKVYGITYGVADGPSGGWATHIYLKPGTHCLRMGDVPTELYMAGGCSLPTAVHAVERADIALGDVVLVLGAGPVGLSVIALSLLRGAQRVLCIGAPDARLRVAAAVGASDVLNFTNLDQETRRQWVQERTQGRGVDVTVECTGAPQGVAQALDDTRDAGTVVVVGQYTDHGGVEINPHLAINRKHLTIKGCWGSDFSHFHRSIEMLQRRDAAARWSAIPLEHIPLERVNEALDKVASGEIIKALVRPGGID